MMSPWDIHTAVSEGMPSKIPAGSSMSSWAAPYSRRLAGSTTPPRSWASSCIP